MKSELLKRIKILPISLVLSQTAIESAWGTSRFCVEANNLFGVWSFNNKGLIPKRRKRGMKHRIAVYNSLLDSVRDYMLKINTLRAYRKLRNIREYTMNSIYLTKGLIHYSERKEAYIKDLQKMINKNRLKKYDSMHLKGNKI
jgi:Bax protein